MSQVFQCPGCREFIATDAKKCRFCSLPIDESVAQTAAENQAKENKTYRRRQYAKHMLTGGGVFALGLLITLGTLVVAFSSESGGSYVITWGLMFVGGADFLYGLVGWLSELKSR